ncbi:hypothetical protein ONE63_011242 [Megalurothrips usitatus]|uniref:Uncharacterized protein n=1 Tax=Megalurothrips usitatus TaxID=439358 RepID=A0AAV7X3E3_9NEOP|nr:hypothetical protein ONE63_011242 [Megalurothrips usitatus]
MDFAKLKRDRIGWTYEEGYFNTQIDMWISTPDDEFVRAAVKVMSTADADFMPFVRHVPNSSGHLLQVHDSFIELGEKEWIPSLCSTFELPAPSEYTMFVTMGRPSSSISRTVIVDLVPDFVSDEEVMSSLVDQCGAKIDSFATEDLPASVWNFAADGMFKPRAHRNIIVMLESDLDALGSVFSRGLTVCGLTFRVRPHLSTMDKLVDREDTPRARSLDTHHAWSIYMEYRRCPASRHERTG